MATERLLIDYLPPYEQGYLEMQHIMNAEQPEIDGMWSAFQDIFADQYIMDATVNGVKRWETMIGVSPKDTDTLDERKFRILTILNQELPYTLTRLKEVLITLCGVDGFFIELKPSEYHIEVKLALGNISNYQDVVDLLKKMIPANMTQVVQIMFNTHETLAQFTHQFMSAYTHDQLRKEVFE